MDNITSGSIVESRMAQPNQTSKSKALLIVSILEAVIIVGLVIGLMATFLSVKTEAGDFDGEIGEIDEGPEYNLEVDDASALRFAHAITNRKVFASGSVTVPASVCEALQKIFNSFPNGDSSIGNPCQGGTIALFSMDEEDADLAARGVSHVGIKIGEQSYNYYFYSDYSAIEYLSEDNEVPTSTITFNVGG